MGQRKDFQEFKGLVVGWKVTCLRACNSQEDHQGWVRFSDKF